MRKTKIVSVTLLALMLSVLLMASASFVLAKKESFPVAFGSNWATEEQDSKYAGNTWFRYEHRTGTLDGSITGDWESQVTLMYQRDDASNSWVLKRITGVYAVQATSINGESKIGTFDLKIESDGSTRTWTINKGTADLKGIQGAGTYEPNSYLPNSVDLYRFVYTGEITLKTK